MTKEGTVQVEGCRRLEVEPQRHRGHQACL